MTGTARLVAAIRKAGGRVALDADSGLDLVAPDHLARLADRYRASVVAQLVEERYVFEERAAIMEHDGHLPRREAERLAGLCAEVAP